MLRRGIKKTDVHKRAGRGAEEPMLPE